MQPFSILLGLGTFLGLLLTVWRAPEKETSRYLYAGLWTLLGALVVSRAFVVFFNFQYYQGHLAEIPRVWLGGLSGIGALAGGILVMIILSILWKLPAGELADALFPLAGVITIFTWLGCWLDGCAYGFSSDLWWALPGRNEWGIITRRIPVQLLGATLTLLLLWILDKVSKRTNIPGLIACLGVFGISSIIFALSFLRADPTPAWNGLRSEAWGALGLMLFSLVSVVVLLVDWKFRRNPRITKSGSGRYE